MGVDRTLPAALRKAFQAAGMNLPAGGRALLTIADADKPEMFSIVSRLTQLGYQVLATSGTAAALRRAGFSPREVGKIGEGGSVVDVINAGEVDLVINTMSGTNGAGAPGRPVMKDGFEIRRAAVERRIPCLTSLDTAAALLESAVTVAGALEVRTISEWRLGAA
jgi:carbamoyl-phosphate synthase large subunit